VGRIRASGGDLVFAAVVVALTTMAARVWWLSAIVPGQDYPQFLVFVRALQDTTDPSSPFHGTYTTAAWFVPTSLPVHLTSLLARALHGSIESAAKLLMTFQNVGLVAASLFLTKTLDRPRWTVILVFPLIHSAWTIVGGFVAFATALPVVILGWALAVRWLRTLDARAGAALAACACITLLWHGIAYVQLSLSVAVLWMSWRASNARARVVALAPMLPSLALFAAWTSSTFGTTSTKAAPAAWQRPSEAAASIVAHVWATVPRASAQALIFCLFVAGGLALRRRSERKLRDATWRVSNPFLVLGLVHLVAYFVLPISAAHVEGISNRFPYVAALAFVFAWELPRARLPRAIVSVAAVAFSIACLEDVARRVRAFEADTRGASDLIDLVGRRETLIACPPQRGRSSAFGDRENKAMLEIEQYATIRSGGLPNSSFAGYGSGYIRYVDGRNPMPGLPCTALSNAAVRRFDYLLARSGDRPADVPLQLMSSRGGWELYGICGSQHLPACAEPPTSR
jgi:hypothetical protein